MLMDEIGKGKEFRELCKKINRLKKISPKFNSLFQKGSGAKGFADLVSDKNKKFLISMLGAKDYELLIAMMKVTALEIKDLSKIEAGDLGNMGVGK